MKSESIKYIVLHCSATPCNKRYDKEQMLRDHKNRGFYTWGYHYYVRRDGTLENLRPPTEAGAHVRGYNTCSIGICYEGGLLPGGQPADTRTREQRRTLRRLVAGLRLRYPKAMITGHRDLSPDRNGNGIIEETEWLKLCPCFDAAAEYEWL
ncbi:N-acetylmuramoyl-L-alanine amidase [Porphyromonas macacae]|uniref:N-acetylmuramoyl-L-alanine amidase n=1 Tax=Porphyromonas macacae TaxID=28115 RepID=A0A379DFE5_9PORP|nr:N-acetylmuramoyl-L-alanine amidase [Porphyromonas macacae]SUB77051.1 N-acetylmuramoyl-L-alanine amidase [Porphyromonas macacae]